MTKTFTQIDILKFYYNEVTETEKKEIETALLWDNSLADYYQELIEMEVALDKVKKQPSERCIENILNYSRTHSMQTV
ncbi:MAG: hypothetical protein K2X86_17715 [Cytophagaceae bacterium]|nr:hypothetical protein [Cytophagaceae bacterium]